MTSVYISPNKHIFIKVEDPENHKIAKIYTGYTAEEPEAIEKAITIKEKLVEQIKESKRYLRL